MDEAHKTEGNGAAGLALPATPAPAPAAGAVAAPLEVRAQPWTATGGGDPFLRRFVVVTVICVSSLIALAIIFAAVLVPVFTTSEASEELKNWGGLIIGFYFGTFVTLLKDWLADPAAKGAQ